MYCLNVMEGEGDWAAVPVVGATAYVRLGLNQIVEEMYKFQAMSERRERHEAAFGQEEPSTQPLTGQEVMHRGHQQACQSLLCFILFPAHFTPHPRNSPSANTFSLSFFFFFFNNRFIFKHT